MAYVYRHIRLDKNVPFYIGIGKDKYLRRAYSVIQRSRFWERVVSKTDYDVEIMFNEIDYSDAIIKEKEFIKLYGRKDLGLGTLVNLTDGGEGNCNWSPEQKQKQKNSRAGKKISEETRKKLSDSHKGYIPTLDQRRKISEASKRNGISKETREKMASKLRGRPQPEWQRKILSEAAKGKKVYWSYKPIYQFSLKGDFIKEFENITQAANELSLTSANINKVLSGKRYHCGNYFFEYKNDDFNATLDKVKNKALIKHKFNDIKVININTNIEYSTIKEAAKNEGMPYWELKRVLSSDSNSTNLRYNTI